MYYQLLKQKVSLLITFLFVFVFLSSNIKASDNLPGLTACDLNAPPYSDILPHPIKFFFTGGSETSNGCISNTLQILGSPNEAITPTPQSLVVFPNDQIKLHTSVEPELTEIQVGVSTKIWLVAGDWQNNRYWLYYPDVTGTGVLSFLPIPPEYVDYQFFYSYGSGSVNDNRIADASTNWFTVDSLLGSSIGQKIMLASGYRLNDSLVLDLSALRFMMLSSCNHGLSNSALPNSCIGIYSSRDIRSPWEANDSEYFQVALRAGEHGDMHVRLAVAAIGSGGIFLHNGQNWQLWNGTNIDDVFIYRTYENFPKRLNFNVSLTGLQPGNYRILTAWQLPTGEIVYNPNTDLSVNVP